MRVALFSLLASLATSSLGLAQEGPHGMEDPPRYVEGEESEALEALRRAEEAMFERRQALVDDRAGLTRGIPDALTSEVAASPLYDPGSATPWLEGLELPDLPIRWHAQVVRYLEYFRENPRGRSMMQAWIRRSTRYGPMIRDALERQELPTDLRCVAMAESGFDPTVRSRVGAVGMWQFVEGTGREYGLHADRWVDQRMDPVASTDAAARMLGDLHQRFRRWELALAAYNMGYGALLRSVRKYNTNDYWVLAELEAGLPFETTIYVAKIMACSVVMRNAVRFGFEEDTDPAIEVESFEIEGGIGLGRLARAAGVDADLLGAINPHLRRGRTPPGRGRTSIHIPAGESERFARAWTRLRAQAPVHRAYVVRFGEDLDDVARRFRTRSVDLREMNGIESDEVIGPGVALLVPAVEPREPELAEAPVVPVPAAHFAYPDRRRVFYRAHSGEDLRAIARFFEVDVDDLRRWNDIDPSARLHGGMFLQIFAPSSVDLSQAVVLDERAVRLTTVGTEEFFDEYEESIGRVRFRYRCREGDTMRSLSRRFGLSVGSIARINRFSRRADLVVGQEVVLYAERERVPARYLRDADAVGDAADVEEVPSETDDEGDDELGEVDELGEDELNEDDPVDDEPDAEGPVDGAADLDEEDDEDPSDAGEAPE